LPQELFEAAAAFRACDETLDGRHALRVAQVPQVLPDQLRLARMHQAAPGQVINEEVAVVAEVELPQDGQRFVARLGIIAISEVGDGGARQFDVVAQLVLARREDDRLHHVEFSLDQRTRFQPHHGRHGRNGDEQGHDGQQDELQT